MRNNIDHWTARVHLIEDNADNVLVIQVGAQAAGIQNLTMWGSGKYFFDWLKAHPTEVPDLLLLDIQIPREDGFAILRQIRGMPELNDMLVVAVTSTLDRETIQRCVNMGFVGFIAKPIKPELFPGQLHRILARQFVWEPSS